MSTVATGLLVAWFLIVAPPATLHHSNELQMSESAAPAASFVAAQGDPIQSLSTVKQNRKIKKRNKRNKSGGVMAKRGSGRVYDPCRSKKDCRNNLICIRSSKIRIALPGSLAGTTEGTKKRCSRCLKVNAPCDSNDQCCHDHICISTNGKGRRKRCSAVKSKKTMNKSGKKMMAMMNNKNTCIRKGSKTPCTLNRQCCGNLVCVDGSVVQGNRKETQCLSCRRRNRLCTKTSECCTDLFCGQSQSKEDVNENGQTTVKRCRRKCLNLGEACTTKSDCCGGPNVECRSVTTDTTQQQQKVCVKKTTEPKTEPFQCTGDGSDPINEMVRYISRGAHSGDVVTNREIKTWIRNNVLDEYIVVATQEDGGQSKAQVQIPIAIPGRDPIVLVKELEEVLSRFVQFYKNDKPMVPTDFAGLQEALGIQYKRVAKKDTDFMFNFDELSQSCAEKFVALSSLLVATLFVSDALGGMQTPYAQSIVQSLFAMPTAKPVTQKRAYDQLASQWVRTGGDVKEFYLAACVVFFSEMKILWGDITKALSESNWPAYNPWLGLSYGGILLKDLVMLLATDGMSLASHVLQVLDSGGVGEVMAPFVEVLNGGCFSRTPAATTVPPTDLQSEALEIDSFIDAAR